MSKQSSKRESHKQALRQLLDRYVYDITVRGQPFLTAQLVDEILRINDRFAGSPTWLDEALNSGDGTYKP